MTNVMDKIQEYKAAWSEKIEPRIHMLVNKNAVNTIVEGRWRVTSLPNNFDVYDLESGHFVCFIRRLTFEGVIPPVWYIDPMTDPDKWLEPVIDRLNEYDSFVVATFRELNPEIEL